ncbi:MAG: hypothetical protein ACR2I2_20955, partial [Bryobacteraceae bacterium]
MKINVPLLDVNVLVALVWRPRAPGWAACAAFLMGHQTKQSPMPTCWVWPSGIMAGSQHSINR